jgi:hypothetical protein
MTAGLSLLFVFLSIVVDEVWARDEKKKTFNWASLFDDSLVGFLVGVSLGYLDFLTTGASAFSFPWGYIAVATGGATLLAILLEFWRPFRPYPRRVEAVDTAALEREVRRRLKNDEPFVYWQSQNPAWLSIVTVLIPLVLIGSAAYTWLVIPWVSIELFVIGIGLSLFYGGMRTLVRRENVTVRFGALRVKLIPLAEIVQVEVHEFSAIRDFGGFGIRFNRQMTAYFLRGSRGVKLTTARGKQYLIGSDHPEILCAIIRLLVGQYRPERQ